MTWGRDKCPNTFTNLQPGCEADYLSLQTESKIHVEVRRKAMKHSTRTYSAVWAMLLILLLAICPHHHHEGGAACWAVEVCHTDGRANDVHTHHKDKEAHHAMLATFAKHYVVSATSGNALSLLYALPSDFWNKGVPPFRFATCFEKAKRSLSLRSRTSSSLCRRGPPVWM